MSDLRVSPGAQGEASWCEVRLDAPRRRNALTPATISHLHAFLAEHRDDTLLLGSSDPTIFSAGADLSVSDEARRGLSDEIYACLEELVDRPGVSIAVVEGAAVGGGAQLSTGADLRIAGPGARWRWVGPGHGLAVGAWVLPALVGRTRALDLTLNATWVEASEAVAMGLATRLEQDPWTAARELAARLARAEGPAVARVKEIAGRSALLADLRRERTLNREAWGGGAARTP